MTWDNANARKETVAAVTASQTAAQVLPNNPRRRACMIYNNTSGAVIYVGSSADVTALNGFPVVYKAAFIDEHSSDAVWVIADAPSVDVRVIEIAE